jgi:hypothetical protein
MVLIENAVGADQAIVLIAQFQPLVVNHLGSGDAGYRIEISPGGGYAQVCLFNKLMIDAALVIAY